MALRIPDLPPRELGAAGERHVARRWRRAGWRLVGRRVRTPAAEIDLVVADGRTLVCLEVKTGRVGGAPVPRLAPRLAPRPGTRLDARALARQRAAARWLARRLGYPEARVDLVEVLVRPRPHAVRLVHHPDLDRPLDPDDRWPGTGAQDRGVPAPRPGAR